HRFDDMLRWAEAIDLRIADVQIDYFASRLRERFSHAGDMTNCIVIVLDSSCRLNHCVPLKSLWNRKNMSGSVARQWLLFLRRGSKPGRVTLKGWLITAQSLAGIER